MAPHVSPSGYSFHIRTLANPLPGRRHGAKSDSGGVFCLTGKSVIWLSSPARKNIPLLRRPKSILKLRHPVPHRGAFRDRHGRWARDAVDAAASGARIARGRMTLDLRTAKSCGPDAPTLASSLRDFPQATVAKEPGHRGARSKPLKPLRRESWVFR